MYRYTDCPQCGQQVLLSTEPEPSDPHAYSGRSLHCDANFTFHEIDTEPLPSEPKSDWNHER